MQDLSKLAEDSMWPTSQAAGNRQSKPDKAMTAPGSSPVDRELDTANLADPHVELDPPMPPGTDGKPQASGQAGYSPAPAAWKPASPPQVIRSRENGTTRN
ncbi:MAG TPA: hypothetical protein VNH17_12510 [Streptosporangiaceae bacterium]|nr:hypothetical protein [Streptosporangiaceae bacterium]